MTVMRGKLVRNETSIRRELLMKALVVYDTTFGNTQIIAETIAGELGADARAVAVSEVTPAELQGLELLVVGSPIIGWKPSEKMGAFLLSLRRGQLQGVKAATFDTRVKLFFHGDAAKKIAKALKNASADIFTAPEAFYVQGKEGPLLAGENEKAIQWAKTLKVKGKFQD